MSQFTPTQLKKHKKHEIDEMLDKGVFQKNNNIVPITIKGLLPDEPQRPEWMKVKADLGKDYRDLKNLISEKKLNTVCEEASCPNIYECWSMGTATFMIMGDTCTRACGFCDVNTGKPCDLDDLEPLRVAESVQAMELTPGAASSDARASADARRAHQPSATSTTAKRRVGRASRALMIVLCGNVLQRGLNENLNQATPALTPAATSAATTS